MSQSQEALMEYCPATGTCTPYPSHAEQWRTYHGKAAWLYNPWSGLKRDARDVGSDTFGQLICPSMNYLRESAGCAAGPSAQTEGGTK